MGTFDSRSRWETRSEHTNNSNNPQEDVRVIYCNDPQANAASKFKVILPSSFLTSIETIQLSLLATLSVQKLLGFFLRFQKMCYLRRL
jgi:hypothetical protein